MAHCPSAWAGAQALGQVHKHLGKLVGQNLCWPQGFCNLAQAICPTSLPEQNAWPIFPPSFSEQFAQTVCLTSLSDQFVWLICPSTRATTQVLGQLKWLPEHYTNCPSTSKLVGQTGWENCSGKLVWQIARARLHKPWGQHKFWPTSLPNQFTRALAHLPERSGNEPPSETFTTWYYVILERVKLCWIFFQYA